jgi:ATP-binding cassette subfamily B protein
VGIIISIVVAMAIFIVIVLPKFKATQKATDQLNNSSREIIGGVRVVRAFNAQKYENQKFLKINDNLTKLNSFTISYMEGMVGTITILISLLTPLTYLVAALLFS